MMSVLIVIEDKISFSLQLSTLLKMIVSEAKRYPIRSRVFCDFWLQDANMAGSAF